MSKRDLPAFARHLSAAALVRSARAHWDFRGKETEGAPRWSARRFTRTTGIPAQDAKALGIPPAKGLTFSAVPRRQGRRGVTWEQACVSCFLRLLTFTR